MIPNKTTSLNKEADNLFQEQIFLFNHFDDYRSQWDDMAIKWYKQVVGFKKELKEDNGRSNVHIPRTYQIIDTIRSRYIMGLFKDKPYIDYIPKPSNLDRFPMDMAEDKAKVAAALANEQLDKNNIVSKYYDYITSLLIFPLGIMGVGWRYEEDYVKRKVPIPEIVKNQFGIPQYTGRTIYQPRQSIETTWDDNEINNIDYFDFWPDPKGTTLDGCRGVFQREFVTFEKLEHRLKFLEYLDEGKIYLNNISELKELQGSVNLEHGREERLSEVGFSSGSMDIFQNTDYKSNKNAEFELLHYWEDDRHCITVNRKKVVYDGPSPYWRHKKKPFVVGTYDRLPSQLYGMSAAQIISDIQEEENTLHNQRTDNINFILNKMWKVRTGADIDESELISRPHGIIHVDRPEDVTEFEMSDVASSSFSQQGLLQSLAENALATPPVIQGAESSGSKTATETMKQTTNAGMRFDVKMKLFQELNINRMAYLMDMNNQQFIDGERVVNINIDQANAWKAINPGDLIGEFDYRPAGTNIDPAANKEVRREQLTHMMQFLLQSQVPFVNYKELFEEWLKSFDVENAEKFLLSDQEMQQQQMQQQMQQQQQATAGQQSENAATGRARGRRPQQERNPSQQSSGQVR